MIYLRLYGGLGNQIFQLAAALILAKKNNRKKIIIDDFALTSYKIKRDNNLVDFFDFSLLDIELEFRKCLATNLRLPRLLPLKLPYYPFISDSNFNFLLHHSNFPFCILDGYFQDCLTQEEFYQEIELMKNIFINKSDAINDGCVIHIRGGDFLMLGWNEVSSPNYYKTAIAYMINNYHINQFDVITDDEVYARELLSNIEIKFNLVGSSMADDFYRLGTYSYRILSSSSFAFWASALGSLSNPVVIAPKMWTPLRHRNLKLFGEVDIE